MVGCLCLKSWGCQAGVHARRAAFRTLDRKRVQSAERQASMAQKAKRKDRSLAATGGGPTGEAYQAAAFSQQQFSYSAVLNCIWLGFSVQHFWCECLSQEIPLQIGILLLLIIRCIS